MKKVVMLGLIAWSCLYGGALTFESGVIKGHTEVFGDSTIDPVFKKAVSHLTMDDSPSTLKGSLEVSIADFVSDNKKRDTHMYETMESTKFPKSSFEIKEVISKGGDKYQMNGLLTLHGVQKPINFEGVITSEGNKIHIKAAAITKMSDFGITPPKMVFLTVRDQVDITVDVLLKR